VLKTFFSVFGKNSPISLLVIHLFLLLTSYSHSLSSTFFVVAFSFNLLNNTEKKALKQQ
jgi:hypothetical protein